MLDEQVLVLRKLWSEPVVDFTGKFHRIDRANVLPLPDTTIPIWFGGTSPAALRRAAALGDGFSFATPLETQLCKQLTAGLDANGRRDGFGIDTMMGFGYGPERWHKEIEIWEALGADSMSIRTMTTGAELLDEKDPGFTSPQQHIGALETFMREVG